MVQCPDCGKALAGNPRVCGYCGASLVINYFSQPDLNPEKTAALGGGSAANITLGVFGGLALLAALAVQLFSLFGSVVPDLTIWWWIRTLALALLPVIYLVQLLVLRGVRFSLLFDCGWLFLATCGFSATALVYLVQGVFPFGGMVAVPYLLAVGCALVMTASITGILAYRR